MDQWLLTRRPFCQRRISVAVAAYSAAIRRPRRAPRPLVFRMDHMPIALRTPLGSVSHALVWDFRHDHDHNHDHKLPHFCSPSFSGEQAECHLPFFFTAARRQHGMRNALGDMVPRSLR